MVSPQTNSQLTLFTADTLDPASHSVAPVSALARMMNATYGPQCSESLTRLSPLGWLEKMLKVTYPWASTQCSMTWKIQVLKHNRFLYRLALSKPPTAVNGSSWFLTPRATDTGRGEKSETFVKRMGDRTEDCCQSLPSQLGGIPNPEFVEWLMGFPAGWTDLEASETP